MNPSLASPLIIH